MQSNTQNITNILEDNIAASSELSLLSINQARQILKVRHSSIQELINTGQIEFVEINNRKKIPMIKLRNFINRSSKVIKDKREVVKTFETSSIKNKLKNIIKKHGRR